MKTKLCHLQKSPGNIDTDSIHIERAELSTLFLQLKQMQLEAGVAEPNAPIISSSEISDAWDDLAFDPVLPDVDTTPISFVPELVSFQPKS